MLNAIRPILVREVPSLSWKLDFQKSPYQNLCDLLTITKTVRTTIEDNSSPVADHLKLRETYKTLLAEMSQSLESLETLENYFESEKTQEDGLKVEQETPQNANRAFLLLQAKEPQLRKKSLEYGLAWKEIEAQYQLKVTLYYFQDKLKGQPTLKVSAA